MARPTKYNWDKIKADYESGMSDQEICNKHNIPKSTLSTKKTEQGWVVSEQAKTIIKGFEQVSEQITELSELNPELAKNIVQTLEEYNPKIKKLSGELNIRILEKAKLMIEEVEKPSELFTIAKTSQVVTDTHGVSQRHSNTQINTQVNTQVNTNVELTEEEIKEELKNRGLPIDIQ